MIILKKCNQDRVVLLLQTLLVLSPPIVSSLPLPTSHFTLTQLLNKPCDQRVTFLAFYRISVGAEELEVINNLIIYKTGFKTAPDTPNMVMTATIYIFVEHLLLKYLAFVAVANFTSCERKNKRPNLFKQTSFSRKTATPRLNPTHLTYLIEFTKQ